MTAVSVKERGGCDVDGIDDLRQHHYFNGGAWEVVDARRLPSPLHAHNRNLKQAKPSSLKRIEATIEEANAQAQKPHPSGQTFQETHMVADWDCVCPVAVANEYMEHIHHNMAAV